MNKIIKNNLIIAGIIFLFLISCGKQEVHESSLEMRDSLIYKKGEMKPFTGHEKALIQDKVIEYDVVNGIKQGDFKLYFPNGKLQIEGIVDKNKNVGEWKYYYESGELESKGLFENDKPKGEWTWYYPSGKIKERGNYFEGNRIGTWQQFDETGIITDVQEFSLQDSVTGNKNYLDQIRGDKTDQ